MSQYKYHIACRALIVLEAKLGEVGWMVRLLLLHNEDVRQLRDLELDSQKWRTKKQKKWEKKEKGKGYIELFWIWSKSVR